MKGIFLEDMDPGQADTRAMRWQSCATVPEKLQQLASALAGQQLPAAAVAQPCYPLRRLPGDSPLCLQHLRNILPCYSRTQMIPKSSKPQ